MHILEHHDPHGQNARTSTAEAAQDDLEKSAKTARGTESSSATPSTVAAVTDAKRASSIEGAPFSPTLSSQRRPPYLAAGVLPFCVIGGDLLFLLGQQLRFCSRGRGASFSESDWGSAITAAVADGVGGGTAVSARGVELRESTMLGPPPRRPRRGPRPKLSSPPPPSPPTLKPFIEKALPKRVPRDSSLSPPLTPPSSSSIASHHARIDDGATDGEPCGASTSMTHYPQPHRPESAEVLGAREVTMKKVNAPRAAATAATTSPPEVEACVPTEIGMSPAVTPDECSRGSAQDSVPAGLLWSDFGGGREAGDADAEETASREFAEESFGLFNGVRLQSDSVARSQATMEAALRDPTVRGKRVFECRNGSYVMFIAEVDFVPDIMMKLARKEIMDSGGREGENSGGCRGGGGLTASGSFAGGKALSPGFSEKTDFAWVPATSLLKAMRESRNRSTRRVVVKLGDCRYLRLFHKFVISLWRLDLAAVIRAALTPLPQRNRTPFPAPRILLLKHAATHGDGNEDRMAAFIRGGDRGTNSSIKGSTKYAIRGIDCVRPSFLSGRKRTSLGIIDPSCELLRARPSRRSTGGSGSRSSRGGKVGEDTGSERGAGAATGSASLSVHPQLSSIGGQLGKDGGLGGRQGNCGRLRSRKSGAACRKRRRQRKEARRLKAVTAAAASTQAEPEERAHAL